MDSQRVDTWLDLLERLEGVAEVTTTGQWIALLAAENVV
jgi:hypothetical protein